MILILDDNAKRLDGFRTAAAHLGEGWSAHTARNAPAWIALAGEHLANTRLISLDHDLDPADAGVAEPGTGRDAADWLAQQPPVCPVLVHTSNTDAAWGMHNVLLRAKWPVELVHHLNDDLWIGERWLPMARRMVAAFAPMYDKPDPTPDWLLAALSRYPPEGYGPLQRELDTWREEFRARAFFRIAVAGNEAGTRAAEYLLDCEPALAYSCEQALRKIAGSLNADAQQLVFYLVTQYGKAELKRSLHRLWQDDYAQGQLPSGLNNLEYWLRPPTLRLRPVSRLSSRWSEPPRK